MVRSSFTTNIIVAHGTRPGTVEPERNCSNNRIKLGIITIIRDLSCFQCDCFVSKTSIWHCDKMWKGHDPMRWAFLSPRSLHVDSVVIRHYHLRWVHQPAPRTTPHQFESINDRRTNFLRRSVSIKKWNGVIFQCLSDGQLELCFLTTRTQRAVWCWTKWKMRCTNLIGKFVFSEIILICWFCPVRTAAQRFIMFEVSS